MFAPEAKAKGIDIDLELGTSLRRLNVDYVNTDHVRLRQIVTNLVANAIRFTANSPIRKITVRYDIARSAPDESTCAVSNMDGLVAVRSFDDRLSMSEGTPLWLFVSVIDTGPGLTTHERNILFQRFTRECMSSVSA